MQHHHAEAFECEICGTPYKEAAHASACEAGGPPSARFQQGDAVKIIDGEYHQQFGDQPFRVVSRDTALDRPGLEVWEPGEPGKHMTVYVLEAIDDGWRITFVPDYHLAPLEAAHA